MRKVFYPLLALLLLHTIAGYATTISGSATVCAGLTTTFNIDTTGGTWSSGTPGNASVDPATGVITGHIAGTALISYNLPAATFTRIVTVYAQPPAITGADVMCEGLFVNLNNTMGPVGAFTSGNTSVATVVPNGKVTGVSAGTALISYTVATSGCFATREVTVNPLPTPISNPGAVCPGGSTTLTSSPGGGTWISNNPSVATIDPTTGELTSISGGMGSYYLTVISYTLPTGCRRVAQVTVNSSPGSIIGTLTMCSGSTSTLTCGTPGGVWSSSNAPVATISAAGVVSAISNGISTISYTTGAGCGNSVVVTVNTGISANTGTATVCVGQTTTLSNSTPTGTWFSDNTSVASVNSGTGVVSGVSGGTANITYTVGAGCTAVTQVTVNSAAAAITGNNSICVNGSTTLAYPVTGGTWSSSNTAVATINVATGAVTPIIAGTTTVTYTVSPGCFKTVLVTILPLPGAISGPVTVCQGSTITLSSSPAGGAWTSGSANAAVTPSTGIVTGNTAGTALISYTIGGSCRVTYSVSVHPLPAAISGSTTVCTGGSTTLTSDGTGTWSSSVPAKATVNAATGLVTGISAGTSVISYAFGTGCFRTTTVTVTGAPAAITGSLTICNGNTTALNAATSGKVWVSANTAVATVDATSGVVTAISAGNAAISYTVGSCAAAPVTVTVTAGPPANDGTPFICIGPTVTLLTNSIPGGTWSASNTKVTINPASGLVKGKTVGTVDISYSTGTGCYAVTNVTVYAAMPAITGPTTVCPDGQVTLANTFAGGTWSSSNTAKATVDEATGVVTGVSAGTSIMTYMAGPGCFNTRTQTTSTPPASITGAAAMCEGTTSDLNISTGGGTWSSSDPTKASVNLTTGLVTGNAAGTAGITYRVTSTGCTSVREVTINPTPTAITGSTNVCVGGTTTLNTTSTGGSWSCNWPVRATIDPVSGLVTGVAAGTAIISYTLGEGCYSTIVINVLALPADITGLSTVCPGSTISLTSATAGGTWSSSNTAAATVALASGLVAGVSAGSTIITYTIASSGCYATTAITVSGGADAGTISGGTTMNTGGALSLTTTGSGGVWTSSNAAIASVNASGQVAGIAPGTVVIMYTVGSSCGSATATHTINVNAVTVPITGSPVVCQGNTTMLSNTNPGGSWTSANPDIATVNAGTVAGIMPGTATISYTIPGGTVTKVVTVLPLPDAGTIMGENVMNTGGAISLSNGAPGGSWSSSNIAIASVSASGAVTGLTPGTVVISYTVSNSCGTDVATHTITVNAATVPIAGVATVCAGSTTVLSNENTGGSWTSADPDIATVSAGLVAGIMPGTATISYTVPAGTVTKVVTVLPLPNAGTITGASTVNVDATIGLSNAAEGGVWSSSNTDIATVNTVGMVTGIAVGSAQISYVVTNSCGTAFSVKNIAVTTPPCPSTWAKVGGGIAVSDPDHSPWEPMISIGGHHKYVIYTEASYSYVKVHNGNTWETVGDPTSLQAEGKMAVDHMGTPYVAYRDIFADSRMTVKKYNGSEWEIVGAPAFTEPTSEFALTVDGNGTPYLAQIRTSPELGIMEVIVYKFEGTDWVEISTIGLSSSSDYIGGLDVKTDRSNTLYVSYTQSSYAPTLVQKAKVRKYSEGHWLPVGNQFDNIAYNPRTALAFDGNNVPYIAHQDGNYANVKKYNGTDWETVGSVNFSDGEVYSLTLQIATGNIPYVSYLDAANGQRTTVKKFNSTLGDWESPLGSVLSNGYSNGQSMAVDENGTPVIAYADLSLYTFTGHDCLAVKYLDSDSWKYLQGGQGQTYQNSFTTVLPSMAAHNGVPYIAFEDNLNLNNSVSVMKFENGIWNNVGVPGFSGEYSPMPKIAIGADGIPYVLHILATTSNNGYVAKFNGTSWENLGSTEFATSLTPGVYSLTIDNSGSPYVAYMAADIESPSGNSIYIKKFNGISWEAVGIPYPISYGFSLVSIKTDNEGTPYVSFTTTETYTSYECKVIKYADGAWSELGTPGFALAYTVSFLSISPSGIPYIVFDDYTHAGRISVMKYVEGAWEYVGLDGLSSTFAGLPTITFGPSEMPYVTFPDESGQRVLRFNGSEWVDLLPDFPIQSNSYDNSQIVVNEDESIFMGYSRLDPYGFRFASVLKYEPLPENTGNLGVCPGKTIALSNTHIGGIWNSENPSVATVNYLGVVHGLAAGTTTVSYTLGSCTVTSVVTVLAAPAAISGESAICNGSNTTLSSDGDVTWSSNNSEIASIGSLSGLVTGVSAGTAVITVTKNSTGCSATRALQVDNPPVVGPVSCNASVVLGNSMTALNIETGGTWSSSNTEVATVDPIAGLISGVSVGSTVITYAVNNSCGSMQAVRTIEVLSADGSCTNLPRSLGTISNINSLSVYDCNLVSDSKGRPYIVNSHDYVELKSSVLFFDGNRFVPLGNQDFANTSGGSFTSIAFDANDVPYIAYTDNLTSYAPVVKKYNKTTDLWEDVGSPFTTTGNVSEGAMTFGKDGTLYLITSNTYDSTSVWQYNGTEWSRFGKSFGYSTRALLTVAKDGTLYSLVYENYSISGYPSARAYVFRNGVWNNIGGLRHNDLQLRKFMTDDDGRLYIIHDRGVAEIENGILTEDFYPEYSEYGVYGNNQISNAVVTGDGVVYGMYVSDEQLVVGKLVAHEWVQVGDNLLSNSIYTPGSSPIGHIAIGSNSLPVCSFNNSYFGIRTLTQFDGLKWQDMHLDNPGVSMSTGMTDVMIDNENGLHAAMMVPSLNIGYYSELKNYIVAKFNGANWEKIGANLLTEVYATDVRMAMANERRTAPVVAYNWLGLIDKIIVARFDTTGSGTWDTLGGDGITVSPYSIAELAISTNSNNTPYVAVNDAELNGRITVYKYDETEGSWSVVGSPGFTPENTQSIKITVDPMGVPYVAFGDITNRLNVMKFNGISWITVGDPGFASFGWGTNNLKFTESGVAYISTIEPDASGSVTKVWKFNGASWQSIGGPASMGGVAGQSLAIDLSGTVYLSQSEYEYENHVKVFKYNPSGSGSWDLITSLGSDLSASYYTSIATDNDGTLYLGTPKADVFSGYISQVFKIGTPPEITGANTGCVGGKLYLSNVVFGGSWSSSDPSVAIVNNSGVVYGINSGTAIMTYTLPDGCYRTKVISINSSAASISGPDRICRGSNITFTTSDPVGTWSSSKPTIANAAVETGEVTGIQKGIASITFTVGGTGCYATKEIIVDSTPEPAKIIGPMWVETGSAITLSGYPAGGAWTSTVPSIATIDPVAGTLGGLETGTAIISYTFTNSCTTIETAKSVSVVPAMCSDWKSNGNPGFTSGSLIPNSEHIAVSATGINYMVFNDPTVSNRLSVKRLNPETGIWEYVGTAGFTEFAPYLKVSIEFSSDGTPYIGCSDGSSSIVKKFNGSDWEDVATSIPGVIFAMAFDTSNIIHILLQNDVYVVIKKAIGSSWESVTDDYEGNGATDLTMAIDRNDNIYVGTINGIGIKMLIKDGTILKQLGNEWYMPDIPGYFYLSYLNIKFDENGLPFVLSTFNNSISTKKLIDNLWLGADYSFTETLPYPIYISPVGVGLTLDQYGTTYLLLPDPETSKATLVRHNGSGWAAVGNQNFSPSTIFPSVNSIAIGKDGFPIVSFPDGTMDGALTSMRFGPAAIYGQTSLFVGSNTTLLAGISGGSWSSTNPGVASIDASTGLLEAVTPGTATIVYTAGDCPTELVVTVSATGPKMAGESAATTSQNMFSVFPNPSNGSLNIKTDISGAVSLYTMDGKELKNWEIASGTTTLSLPENLAAGVYMFRFKGTDGSSKMGRLVYQP